MWSVACSDCIVFFTFNWTSANHLYFIFELLCKTIRGNLFLDFVCVCVCLLFLGEIFHVIVINE